MLSILLSAPLLLSTLTQSVYAEGLSNSSNTAVTIEIEAGGPSIGDKGPLDDSGNLISLTVPSVLPFIFNKNGTTTVPTDWTIKNYDDDDVKVQNIYLEPHRDWNIHQTLNSEKPGEFLLDKGKDYKTIELYIGEKDKNNRVSVGLESDENRIKDINMIISGVDEVKENNYNSITLDFKVNRTAFTNASDESNAYTMHIDFNFNKNTLDKNTFQEATQNMRKIYFENSSEDVFNIIDNSNADELSNSGILIKGLETSNGEYHIVSDRVIYAPEDSSYLFANYENLELIDFGENFNTNTALTLEGMFSNCPKLTEITLNKNFGQYNNIPEAGLFSGLFGVNNLTPIKVINANELMRNYDYASDNRNVNFIPKYIDGSVIDKFKLRAAIADMTEVYFEKGIVDSSTITSEIKDLSEDQDMSIIGYESDSGIYHVISQGVIYAPKDGQEMFACGLDNELYNLRLLDLTNFDTSNTTTMYGMFARSYQGIQHITNTFPLETIIFGDRFNTQNVTNMSVMFSDCNNIKNLDLTNFSNTYNVTILDSMFYGCTSLETVNLKSFDTSAVNTMHQMFADCISLENITFGDNWSTENVTTMKNMFYNCSSLKEIDLHNFNTSKVTTMSLMFYECSSLTTLDISTFNTTACINDSSLSIFAYGCDNLKTIIMGPNFIQDYNNNINAKIFWATNLIDTVVINANNEMRNNFNWSINNRIVTFM